jgi:AcrR family transcriptional regulator
VNSWPRSGAARGESNLTNCKIGQCPCQAAARVVKIKNVPRAARKPKTSYHHGDLRDSIRDVACSIVSSKGSAELTVRSVAQRLGVSHAAIYHHFEDRAAILAAVAAAGFEELGQAMDRALAGPDEALLRYREQGLSYVRFAVKNPRIFGLMFTSEVGQRQHRELALAADRLLERIRGAVIACQKEGVLAPGSADEHTLFCWSAVHGLASLIVERQLDQLIVPAEVEAQAALVVDRIFTGLGTRAD